MPYDNIKSHKKQGNCTNNYNPCLYCLQHNPKKWNLKLIITVSDSIFKESWFSVSDDYVSNNIPKTFPKKIFKTSSTCHYFPEAIMKKFVQLTCVVIYLKVLDGGSIFFGIAHCQERGSSVWRRKEENTKVYIFAYKIFANSFFKIYIATAMWLCVLVKWSHCKVTPLQSDDAVSDLQLFRNKYDNSCFFDLYW